MRAKDGDQFSPVRQLAATRGRFFYGENVMANEYLVEDREHADDWALINPDGSFRGGWMPMFYHDDLLRVLRRQDGDKVIYRSYRRPADFVA